MSDRFDELVRNSAAELPDPGEYRRLNRATLRDPVHNSEIVAKRRHSLVMVTACLAVLVLFSGQVSQLGSYDFETTLGFAQDTNGQDLRVHTDNFSGSSVMTNMSDDEFRDYQHAYAANDGVPSKVTGVSYGGKSQWIFYRTFLIDGNLDEMMAKNPDWLPQDKLHDYVPFLERYNRDMRIRTNLLAPHEISIMEIYGVEFRVKSWKHTYPGFGEVTWYRGFPVDLDRK